MEIIEPDKQWLHLVTLMLLWVCCALYGYNWFEYEVSRSLQGEYFLFAY